MNDNHSENLRFLLGGPEKFRSTREMWVYIVAMFALTAASLAPVTFRHQLGLSVVEAIACCFGVWVVGLAVWYSWQRWGRDAFPLRPADGSDP